MPSFFSFIESFFFLSLGITFILIFLMVFHFKQRIEKLERKNNDLSDLCNKIVKEVTNLHSVYLQNNSVSSQNKPNCIPPKEHICENIVISTSYPISFSNENVESNSNNGVTENTYKKIIVMDSIANDDEEDDDDSTANDDEDSTANEDEDEDEDDDYSYDYESNQDYISEIIESELDNIEDIGEELLHDNNESNPMNSSVHVLKLNEVEEQMSEIQIDLMDDFVKNEGEGENEDDVEKEDDGEKVNEVPEKSVLQMNYQQMNYQQMNVKNLKILAISKGLCSDTSKMKRAELVKLLMDGEQDEQR